MELKSRRTSLWTMALLLVAFFLLYLVAPIAMASQVDPNDGLSGFSAVLAEDDERDDEEDKDGEDDEDDEDEDDEDDVTGSATAVEADVTGSATAVEADVTGSATSVEADVTGSATSVEPTRAVTLATGESSALALNPSSARTQKDARKSWPAANWAVVVVYGMIGAAATPLLFNGRKRGPSR